MLARVDEISVCDAAIVLGRHRVTVWDWCRTGRLKARRRDRKADRAIVLLGVTSSSIPEFITATILVVVVGVQLGWLPVLATPPPSKSGAGKTATKRKPRKS